MVKEVKGGTFAPADTPIIKRALQSYIAAIQKIEGYSDRDPHPDLSAAANLLHRLGRISDA
jgi:hypothetical protein